MADPLDEELERFLGQFAPVAPAPLPRHRHASRRTWWALAASALVASGLWVVALRPGLPPASHPSPPPPRATMGELSVVLRRGDVSRVSDALQGRTLADPRRSGRALRSLALGRPGS